MTVESLYMHRVELKRVQLASTAQRLRVMHHHELLELTDSRGDHVKRIVDTSLVEIFLHHPEILARGGQENISTGREIPEEALVELLFAGVALVFLQQNQLIEEFSPADREAASAEVVHDLQRVGPVQQRQMERGQRGLWGQLQCRVPFRATSLISASNVPSVRCTNRTTAVTMRPISNRSNRSANHRMRPSR